MSDGAEQVYMQRNLRGRFIALVIVALFAFAWQSFVTQAHVHFDAGEYSRAVAPDHGLSFNLGSGQSPRDLPAKCLLCKEQAQAGHYLPPHPLAIQCQASCAVAGTVALLIALALSPHARAWHSRAPPVFLES